MSVGSDQINHQWFIIRHKNSFTFFKEIRQEIIRCKFSRWCFIEAKYAANYCVSGHHGINGGSMARAIKEGRDRDLPA